MSDLKKNFEEMGKNWVNLAKDTKKLAEDSFIYKFSNIIFKNLFKK